MALTILTRFKHRSEMVYRHNFAWPDQPGAGFGFEVTADGKLIEKEMTPLAVRNYRDCLSGTVGGKTILDKGVEGWLQRWTEPAVGKCPCGRSVTLEGDNGWGIDCDCGRIYNAFGQELAPREQWAHEMYEDAY